MICSSVDRLGFMVHPFKGDGLYPLFGGVCGAHQVERPALLWSERSKPANERWGFRMTSGSSGKGKVRCAIYTRVSTDQGLDQDFNSLDAV
jgi:hypothetical protein